MRGFVGAALVVVAVTVGCAPATSSDVAFGGAGSEPTTHPTMTPTAGQAPAEVAWRHLATTEGMLPDAAAARPVETAAELAAAFSEHGFSVAPPDVDFERRFVLLLGQPDDACIDELIGLEIRDAALQVEWLPPPGGCNEPLVFRIHAVEVDRRYVPARFDVAFPEPYTTDAEPVTIAIEAQGGAAPEPPAPPRAMTEAELDAVFAGHAVRRCTAADERLPENPAAASPRQEQQATVVLDELVAWLRRQGLRPDVDFVPYVDRREGVRPGLWVDNGRTDEVRRLVDGKFGAGVVSVDANGYDFEAIDQAQRDLADIMGGEGPGSIVSSTGIPGPVQLGVIDPTRATLDRIGQMVDPALVCVYPDLSGVVAD